MKDFIARRFRNAKSGLSLDTEALRRYGDVIDLSIGDTDPVTDERIIDAACRDAKAGHTHYGDPQGDPELIGAVRVAWREDFGQEIAPEEVLVTASSCMGMSQVMFGILDPGDEVLVLAPYFAVYRQQIEMAGGVCVEVPTFAEDGFCPREELLRAAVTPRTKAMIVNTPCNPTGAAYGRETLEAIARVARDCDLLVAADEIYTKYLFEGEFVPMRTLDGMRERTVTLNSFSKNFMMTGWRVGYIIARPDLIRVFRHVNNGMTYTTPSVSQRAALYALSIRDELGERCLRVYRERVYYAADRMARIPWITLVRPKGTFYLFPGAREPGADDVKLCAALLEKAHLLVSPGSAFGEAGRGHFRIAATVPMEKLREAMDRLEALRDPFA